MLGSFNSKRPFPGSQFYLHLKWYEMSTTEMCVKTMNHCWGIVGRVVCWPLNSSMVSIRNHVLLCLSLGLFLVLSNRQPARKIWAERAKVQNVQDVSGCLKQLCSKILADCKYSYMQSQKKTHHPLKMVYIFPQSLLSNPIPSCLPS